MANGGASASADCQRLICALFLFPFPFPLVPFFSCCSTHHHHHLLTTFCSRRSQSSVQSGRNATQTHTALNWTLHSLTHSHCLPNATQPQIPLFVSIDPWCVCVPLLCWEEALRTFSTLFAMNTLLPFPFFLLVVLVSSCTTTVVC